MRLFVKQGEGKVPRAGAATGMGRGTAAGIYEIRRLRRGRCGGLWGRPSSRPAVARYPAPALPLCRAALPGDSFFARVFDKSARVSALYPRIRARFRRKCARCGPSPRVLRAFWAKVRAFQPFTPVFAHDSGESVLVPAFALVFRAQLWRKCARSGLRPRVSRTIQAKMRASGLVLRRVGSVCAGFAPGGAFLERVGSVFAKNAPGKGAGATRPRPCRGTHPAKELRPCRGTPPRKITPGGAAHQERPTRRCPPGAAHQEMPTMSGSPGACQLKRRTKTGQQKRVNKKYVYLHT